MSEGKGKKGERERKKMMELKIWKEKWKKEEKNGEKVLKRENGEKEKGENGKGRWEQKYKKRKGKKICEKERRWKGRICKSCGASYHIIFNAPIKEGVCNECGGELYQRNDDNVESAQTRLNEFFDKTLPLIDYYKNQGKLFEVDASLEMSMVTSNIDAIFEEVK